MSNATSKLIKEIYNEIAGINELIVSEGLNCRTDLNNPLVIRYRELWEQAETIGGAK